MQCFTIKQVAELLGCDEHVVQHHVNSGSLPAVNIGRGIKRPRWRITEQALSEWFEKRSSRPPAPKPKRRRRVQPADYVEFIK